ncbi:MAG: hypothetical protein F6K42_05575 [Leptolyngbya sp. SIO1D8]|nr:hypothetical protein [Leptolyngbya sp. SIO1D8]
MISHSLPTSCLTITPVYRRSRVPAVKKLRVKQLTIELLLWLAAELLLGFLGLDDLADYSEYLKQENSAIAHVS